MKIRSTEYNIKSMFDLTTVTEREREKKYSSLHDGTILKKYEREVISKLI